MKFKFLDGVVRRTKKSDGSPGKGAVIKPTGIYVYPNGNGFIFFENPIDGEDDLSQPFDGHHDAIVYLAGYLYQALKVAKEEV